MIGFETLLTFCLASILLSLAPGPDNIFVLMQSAMHGRRAGLSVTLGLCTGLVAHTLAVTLGVAAVFQVSALAFTLLKLVGVIYLLYLAWGAWRATARVRLADAEVPDLCHWALYRRGILMSTTNPKLAVFFLAFLPQFADPDQGAMAPQLLLLGALFILIGFMVMSLFALLAGSIRNWFSASATGQVVINRLAATVFVGLALKLAVTER